MSLPKILIGVVIMIGLAGLLMAALRPGVSGPTNFTVNDEDGEPDASDVEKQAAILEDREYQRQLHGDGN